MNNILIQIYNLLANVQEIAKANNQYLQVFDSIADMKDMIAAVNERLTNIEKMLTIDIPSPTAAGAEEENEEAA